MEKESVREIKNFLKPLSKIDIVKSFWIYGSSVEKIKKNEKFSLKHDIDVIIIYDDTREDFKEEELKQILLNEDFIEKESEKKNMKFHFQPLRSLSSFWRLLKKGEPWMISSIKNSMVLYDPSNLIVLIKNLLNENKIYSREEKSERLLERAKEKLKNVREKLLIEVPAELLGIVTKSLQIVLMQKDIFVSSTRDCMILIKELENYGLETKYIDFYNELVDLNRKIERGTLSEFNGKDFQKWFSKVELFVLRMETLMVKFEKSKISETLNKTYNETMKICEEILKKKFKNIPKDDYKKIELFKKEFVDKGLIDKTHYYTLNELYEYKNRKKTKKKIEEKYLKGTYLKTLELAIKDIMNKK
ncbi:hypothetical protein AUJ10_03920 [Candidatus Pacearchaeota archaeon CG1_02_31_27]|nr:MAG: hypothetical protein AUJ10_03920 [Candidatus Pacearchaeota archaeon CG1_02_31_27]PIN91956.1 MAG: hypothetical protein COU55_03305 [Candidatus Pacearchaeota archaeon CG10_big_fil_rev_8_21_14_0_10_31_59]PIZ80977.1 MAG: hypothetical protein COX99_01260 [Candidatus Pacearchaeota archaeon CG_4_10_14_0_2_um_filter_31_10]